MNAHQQGHYWHRRGHKWLAAAILLCLAAIGAASSRSGWLGVAAMCGLSASGVACVVMQSRCYRRAEKIWRDAGLFGGEW